MEKYGLHNGWVQDDGGLERFAGVLARKIRGLLSNEVVLLHLDGVCISPL